MQREMRDIGGMSSFLIKSWWKVRYNMWTLDDEREKLLDMIIDGDTIKNDLTEGPTKHDRVRLGYIGEVLKDFCRVRPGVLPDPLEIWAGCIIRALLA